MIHTHLALLTLLTDQICAIKTLDLCSRALYSDWPTYVTEAIKKSLRVGSITMAQLLRILLFTILGACTCMALEEMSAPSDTIRMRRSSSDWTNFPISILVVGGPHSDRTNGQYNYNGTLFNERPIYNGGFENNWYVYYRISSGGYWVLNHKSVGVKPGNGGVAFREILYPPEV